MNTNAGPPGTENTKRLAQPDFRAGRLSSQWRNNERDGVSNHRPIDPLLNRLFGLRSK